MSESILTVEDLRKTYGHKHVLKGVSFDVRSNEILGIMGPNGSGKSTLVDLLVGLRPTSGGKITIDGLVVRDQQLRKLISAQLQNSPLPGKIKVREIMSLFRKAHHCHHGKVGEVLAKVGLEKKADSYYQHLSGGEKRRVSVALALLSKPKVLILDELTTGIDLEGREILQNLVLRLKGQGSSIILITHYVEEAQVICDRVAFMLDGLIVKIDTPDRLVEDLPINQVVEVTFGRPVSYRELNVFKGVSRLACINNDPTRWLLELGVGKMAGEDLAGTIRRHCERNAMPIASLNIRSPNLRDAYYHYCGGFSN